MDSDGSSLSPNEDSLENALIQSLEEQNNRLISKVEGLSRERDAARGAIDDVLSDLLSAQCELEDEKQKPADKDAEIAILQQERTLLFQSVSEKEAKWQGLHKQNEQQRRALRSLTAQFQALQELFDDLSINIGQKSLDMSAPLRATKEVELGAKTRELAEQAAKVRHLENELRWQTDQYYQEQQRREAAELSVHASQHGRQGSDNDVAELQSCRAAELASFSQNEWSASVKASKGHASSQQAA
ncbi:hypothetical protein QQX98_011269 [Neonectria punicea]|uniref:Uncharacterized protein n=1 Tax=Neonectria punicea TaxID=979145 RepID=A0ABR1GM90_9HYPO